VNDAHAASDRELIDPGLVPCAQWRPDPVDVGEGARTVPLYAGVARTPEYGP
jgi:S-adenosyl methyltransferase